MQLAWALAGQPGPWGPEDLDLVRRLLRDPEGPVWEEACLAVGERAAAEPPALEELQVLLGSGSAELRLRGVWALTHLDRELQADVAEFVLERLAEPATLEDAALLAGLLRLAAGLPRDLGEEILLFCLEDLREDVRAAAVASLPDWDPWPRLLLQAADDPSPVVRAALAVSLRFLPSEDEVDQVLVALALDPDPMVAFAVTEAVPLEEELASYGSEPLEREESLRERARELEAALEADPHQWRAILEQARLAPEGLEALDEVGETAGNPRTRDLARALAWLARDDEDSLAGAAGALQGEGGDGCPALASYLDLCLRAAMALTAEDLEEWTHLAHPSAVEELSPEAALAFQDLLDLAGEMLGGVQPSDVLARLEGLQQETEDWPLPERVGLGPVIAAWYELLENPEPEAEEIP